VYKKYTLTRQKKNPRCIDLFGNTNSYEISYFHLVESASANPSVSFHLELIGLCNVLVMSDYK